jgi:hypothetical protein
MKHVLGAVLVLGGLSLIPHERGTALAAEELRVDSVPWPLRSDGWRVDRAWYDGRAEKCVYEATRKIYGLERRYRATAYTNKQHMDTGTTVKSSSGEGLEVFKHHWSERVPTENYDYDFSTATFTATADLDAFKLTVGTQEDCGASFKQVWREGRRLAWLESVYFPDAGMREGRVDGDVVFEDALPLVLRDFPFGSEQASEGLALRVVPSQKSTRSTSFVPVERRVLARGTEELSLPAGTLEAHRLDLMDGRGETWLASYWFAADGGAPWLHALVRYEGLDGTTYRLASLERTAYWER